MNVFTFDEMLTPKLITGLYWLLLLVAAGFGLSSLSHGGNEVVERVALAVIGAIVARVFCELLILAFKMNEALQDLRKK